MPLNGNSSAVAHTCQNASLIALSLFFLPLDFFVLFLSYSVRSFWSTKDGFRGARNVEARKTILVTGIGMTKGLVLARAFSRAGHKVIGADFEPNGALVPGRVSNSLAAFHRLQKPDAGRGSMPYIQGLLDVILREEVDLWVSCSGVASAVEDGEAKEVIENRTDCQAVQFDVATTQTLHEKHTFIDHTSELGLTVPETHTVTSRAAVDEALEQATPGRKFIMKPIGMDDSARGDMTLLPLKTREETSRHLDKLKISDKSAWILQQFVRGSEYCTHAVIIKGKVKVFVACPSAELLMHYEALAPDSALSRAMLKFTEDYAEKGGPGFTGHCSFDFLVEDTSPTDPLRLVLYPIECNPRAHTAVALFNGTPGMVDGYLSLLDDNADGSKTKTSMVVTPAHQDKYYWVGHDLVTRLLQPLMRLLLLQSSVEDFAKAVREVVMHLLLWRDGTFDVRDPLPWFYLYHVYWPMQFLSCIMTGKRWSRINVSTLKMFEC
ncbi:hypothetical protein CLAFUW4_12924 [Fulvia fulva]|uniref:ATP-grasp domain-containing protein n=1 Tax=Passalora fulva TaxID=5499 RepID=A0A9Q8PJJ7_PASFU|nr:uncharacterized protein CLAFUR5_12790 [Fulvia fulva]KAK4611758.1 hypothetical protein CLAFUR4_12928 [Fulvia fulva]KAK4612751.1 hypothetical protein CLAFUR0_12934 [Fulvia fulva]UJO23658.1 hypothetical protein CLAFUR5_12790 [Fulvia fulva]WPV21505.1 hypothetical protein CLAFUW4_12924 [Fulvia fulva]WPV36284.1 hypothetical protein CLAFUW7_12931 [Fulvia fulva]